MWYLQRLDGKFIYLTKDENSVGRKNQDIIIENDDSISRNHASFKIKEHDLYITDTGSKYGSSIGKDAPKKLEPNKDYKLSVDDIVNFGVLPNNQSKFTVKKIDDIFAVLSNLKVTKQTQCSVLEELGVKFSKSSWSKSCTHVIVEELKLTCKVLCAIIVGQHIVNTNFFPDLLKAVQNNTKPPKEKDYRPKLSEVLINKNLNLDYNPEREKLFQGLIFVFLKSAMKESTDDIMNITRGKSISWEVEQISLDELKQDIDKYIFIETAFEAKFESQISSELVGSFEKAIQFLKSQKRRSIPYQEIALAIVYNSTAENCNPLFNRAGLLRRESTQNQESVDIFVYDTENSSKQPENTNQELPSVIEPSFESNNTLPNISSMKRKTADPPNGTENINKKVKINEPSTNTSKPTPRKYSTVQSTIDRFTLNAKEKKNKPPRDPISEDEEENPFILKRKATTKLENGAKKRQISGQIENTSDQITDESVSNKATKERNVVIAEESVSNNSTKENNVDKVKDKPTNKSNSIVKTTGWIGKETDFEEPEKVKEEENSELEKICESLKDSIIVETIDYLPRKQIVLIHNGYSGKNFKTFKKVHQNIQSDIVSNLSVLVVGEENNSSSEDENDENDVDIVSFQSSAKSRKPIPRRRFEFCT